MGACVLRTIANTATLSVDNDGEGTWITTNGYVLVNGISISHLIDGIGR